MARTPGCSHPYLPEYFLTGGNGLTRDQLSWFGKPGLQQMRKRQKALRAAVTKIQYALDHGVGPEHFDAYSKVYSRGVFVDEWKNRWCGLFDRSPHLQPMEKGVLIQQPDGTYIPVVVINKNGRWRRVNTTEAKLMVADPSWQVDPATPRPPEGVAAPELFTQATLPAATPVRRYRPPVASAPPSKVPWFALAIGTPLVLAGVGGVYWATR